MQRGRERKRDRQTQHCQEPHVPTQVTVECPGRRQRGRGGEGPRGPERPGGWEVGRLGGRKTGGPRGGETGRNTPTQPETERLTWCVRLRACCSRGAGRQCLRFYGRSDRSADRGRRGRTRYAPPACSLLLFHTHWETVRARRAVPHVPSCAPTRTTNRCLLRLLGCQLTGRYGGVQHPLP